MRWISVPCLLVCAFSALAQTEDPEVTHAKAGIDRLRALVAAGAAPRAQLERAEEAIADAEDSAFLRKTLYGPELTEAQADDMVAATERRLERRKKALNEAAKLVTLGVASALSVDPYQADLDLARKECELAATRARLTRDLAQMAKAEGDLEASMAQESAAGHRIAERYDGDGVFTASTLAHVVIAYEKRFGKQLPVSAVGETAVHRAMGFDHRGRVDVALPPDTPEGTWLREYLTAHHIPYFAFRQAVAGKATGAHIHLGPMSTRLAAGG